MQKLRTSLRPDPWKLFAIELGIYAVAILLITLLVYWIRHG
jgi:hypothetical protein